MAITLGDAFQNWNPDTGLSNSSGCTVDGGIIAALEPNLFRNKVMLPGITYATDVERLMVDNRYAVAFIRKLDKISVKLIKASDQAAFRVVPTQTDGSFLEIKCNDVLKVAEVVSEPIDTARVSGQTADRVALAGECYDEVKELQFLSYLINGGGSPDATDIGAPASPNVTQSDETTILNNIIDDRATLLKASAEPDTLLISIDTAAFFEKYIAARNYWHAPSETELAVLGMSFAGTLFSGSVRVFRTNTLGQDNTALVNPGYTPTTGQPLTDPRWDWTGIEYVLYDHRTLAIVNLAIYIGLVDYRAIIHNSTLISILSVCGGRIRNTAKAVAKKYTYNPGVKA